MKYIDINPKDWPPLVSLDETSLPKLSSNCLPSWAGEFANAVSSSTETPLELAASIVVAVCSLATARSMTVHIEGDYCEAPVIWTLCALPSGNRKSSTHSHCTAPLRDWEFDQQSDIKSRQLAAESERKTLSMRAEQLRTKASNESGAQADAWTKECAEIEGSLPEVPIPQRLWTSDSTPEKLSDMLAQYGEIFGWFSSEAGFFDIVRGRYSSMPNVDLILNAHSGEASTADRKGSPSVLLRNPRLAVGLAVQPFVLSDIADSKGLRGKGLLARFLYFLPNSPLGFRQFDCLPIPEATREQYHHNVKKMLNWEAPEPTDGLHRVRLSSDALELWQEFRNQIECRMQPDADLHELTDFGGKAPGAAARVACVFHSIDSVGNDELPWHSPLPFETMNRAITFMNCAVEHSIGAFSKMGARKLHVVERAIVEWLRRNRTGSAPTINDVYNGLRGRYEKASTIHRGVARLVEFGYVRSHQKAQTGPGKPPSPNLEVRPGLFG